MVLLDEGESRVFANDWTVSIDQFIDGKTELNADEVNAPVDL
jgi:hypothetical protein